MATPRKRWWRAADSLRREPLTNDELALLVRLACALNERWARDGLDGEAAGRAVFSAGELCDLAGCQSLARARSILRRLAARVGLTQSEDGTRTLVEWRKFAIFQGWASESREDLGLKDAPSASASRDPLPQQEEEERRPAPPAAPREAPAPSSRKRATPRIERPEGFPSAALLAELAAEFPDLELEAAVAEFLAYADREEATYKGERGWTQALRGALLRDRSRGLFQRRVPARAGAGPRRPAPGAGGRPAYPRDYWARRNRELELERANPETHETAPPPAQGRLLA